MRVRIVLGRHEHRPQVDQVQRVRDRARRGREQDLRPHRPTRHEEPRFREEPTPLKPRLNEPLDRVRESRPRGIGRRLWVRELAAVMEQLRHLQFRVMLRTQRDRRRDTLLRKVLLERVGGQARPAHLLVPDPLLLPQVIVHRVLGRKRRFEDSRIEPVRAGPAQPPAETGTGSLILIREELLEHRVLQIGDEVRVGRRGTRRRTDVVAERRRLGREIAGAHVEQPLLEPVALNGRESRGRGRGHDAAHDGRRLERIAREHGHELPELEHHHRKRVIARRARGITHPARSQTRLSFKADIRRNEVLTASHCSLPM
ncbi:MAG: hypothetical protein [Circular genetic element sp.]|nr:MAG: hypothetical protein [Circular genetic element sp.]